MFSVHTWEVLKQRVAQKSEKLFLNTSYKCSVSENVILYRRSVNGDCNRIVASAPG
jgi:hypothetical protein